MKRYTVVVEKAQNNYSAYVPDLPGCITTGTTVNEAKANMQEAVSVHMKVMEELGIPIPAATTPAEALPNDGRY